MVAAILAAAAAIVLLLGVTRTTCYEYVAAGGVCVSQPEPGVIVVAAAAAGFAIFALARAFPEVMALKADPSAHRRKTPDLGRSEECGSSRRSTPLITVCGADGT